MKVLRCFKLKYIQERNPSCPCLDIRIGGGTAMSIGGNIMQKGGVVLAQWEYSKTFAASRPRTASPSIKSRPLYTINELDSSYLIADWTKQLGFRM